MPLAPATLAALAITLAAEPPIVAALYPDERLRMAGICTAATTATHLAMHLILPDLVPDYPTWLLTGESLALVLETAVYALTSRRFGLPRAMIASALANSASFLTGLYLLHHLV